MFRDLFVKFICFDLLWFNFIFYGFLDNSLKYFCYFAASISNVGAIVGMVSCSSAGTARVWDRIHYPVTLLLSRSHIRVFRLFYQAYKFEMRISNNRSGNPSSLCYEDLTLRHFVVSSISVRRARVMNWESMCIVLCCVQCRNLYRIKIISGWH